MLFPNNFEDFSHRLLLAYYEAIVSSGETAPFKLCSKGNCVVKTSSWARASRLDKRRNGVTAAGKLGRAMR